MIKQIIKKEWFKIKNYFLMLIIICIATIGHFWYNLDFSFSTIEPESMMWYRFVHLEQKPYYYISYLLLFCAIVISATQFLPERVKNRVKILCHLPVSLKKSLFMHLLIGLFYLLILATFLTVVLTAILFQYYPNEIVAVFIKDISFYFLGSNILYLGLSAAIIEKRNIYAAVKFIVTLFFIFVFFKNIFTLNDSIWLFIAIFMMFLGLDSFYSTKEQKIKNLIYKLSYTLSIAFVIFLAYDGHAKQYQHTFNRYYIFYSSVIKDFVYQKNFGDHKFEYGIKDKKTFDRESFESYLPFVYWRNLDIQKKLPILIDEKSFDKQTIKSSRLSFSYNPSDLKNKELEIYPLINTNKNIGMIRFPEEVISVLNNRINIYDFDNGLKKELTDNINNLLKSNKITFPIKQIWGKPTNMKPFDLGYFIQDSKNNLFNLQRKDGLFCLTKVAYPKNIDIRFVKIGENRQQKLAGYAIDSKSNFYLIDYKTFEFKQIKLKDFDYQSMKLLFISNPKYYQIRYDNQNSYYSTVFDKNLKMIDTIKLNY